MALSFGRKKGQSTGEADNTTNSDSGGINEANGATQPLASNAKQGKGGASNEPIDESWFETFAEEAAAQNASAAPATPNISVPAAAEPQLSAYDTKSEEPDDFGDFGSKVDLSPSATGTSAAFDNGVFVDPSDSSATPFDVAATPDTVGNTPPASKGGGLKKLLPVLAILLILGGGGAFWMSQQGGEEEVDDLPLTPPAMTQQTGSAPNSAVPNSAKPVTAPPATQGDPKTKAQLKKLWNEGLALRKQNKMAAAKAKWNEAVKLARSKPGHEQSASMIQEAIGKLK